MKKINNKSVIWAFKALSILAFSVLIIPGIASADNSIFGSTLVDPATITSNNTVQIIRSISPSSVNKGVGGETVTVTGEGFSPTSVARVNGVNRPTTFIDSFHLLVQLNSNDTYRNDGGFYISVFDGQNINESYSNAAFFTVNNNSANSSASTNNNNYNNSNSNSSSSSNSTNSNNSNTTSANNNSSSSANTNSGGQTDSSQTGSTTSNSASDLASNAIFGSNSFLPSGLVQWILFGILILLVIILIRRIFGAKEAYEELPMKYE
jgi:hypothetical protein